ncbi:MAG TPA: ATP phosphoribosyltransferase regulatory subunit [Oscillospiraceae bacterium]|nr:ATP phosphoribosyltransferase regulatory subunit [Oscillospiraceae bacterium]
MKRYDLITPEGTKDILFEDCLIRRQVEDNMRMIFSGMGYSEVVTPGIEFYDVFNLNSRHFPQEILYKLTDSKGRLIVLRPDSTMPIARIAATRLREADLPLRLFYSQSVYLANRSMTGKSDEIVQMGIELIGSNSKKADLEVLSTAVEVLSFCDSEKFRLEIGDIGFFRELVSQLDVDLITAENIRTLIEVKNYPALNDLLDSIGDNSATRALKQLPRLFGGEEVFEKASKLFCDEKIEKILSNLKSVYNDLSKLGCNGKITVDLGIVNRTDYYTGIVMKGYLQGYGEEVLSGGRYNNLLSEFGYDVPATGFAVNIDAVADFKKKKEDCKCKIPDAIVFAEKGFEMEALMRCREMKKNGLVVENSVFHSLEETQRYAQKKGISKVIVVNGSSGGNGNV